MPPTPDVHSLSEGESSSSLPAGEPVRLAFSTFATKLCVSVRSFSACAAAARGPDDAREVVRDGARARWCGDARGATKRARRRAARRERAVARREWAVAHAHQLGKLLAVRFLLVVCARQCARLVPAAPAVARVV